MMTRRDVLATLGALAGTLGRDTGFIRLRLTQFPQHMGQMVDLDIARKGPRVSYERCGAYVVNSLEPIYV